MAKEMEVEAKVTELEFSEEEDNQQLLQNEESLLQGLLAAADYSATEERYLEITRGGKTYFGFSIHPLSEDEYAQIRKKYTSYAKNKRLGTRVAEEIDMAKMRCSLIYNATVERDQEKVWNNKALWEGLRKQGHNIVNALDVVEALLLAGEKDQIVNQIDKLSGYSEEDMFETAKN